MLQPSTSPSHPALPQIVAFPVFITTTWEGATQKAGGTVDRACLRPFPTGITVKVNVIWNG